MLPSVIPSHVDDYNDAAEDCETLNSKGGSSGKNCSKRPRQKGPIDMYVNPSPEDAIKVRKDGKEGRQQCCFPYVTKCLGTKLV